ncbi:tetratricopeptide repeat protein [Acidobacteriota bacterium]
MFRVKPLFTVVLALMVGVISIQGVREYNFDLLPGEHKVRPYDHPVRGTAVMRRAKVGANLVFARFIMKFFNSRTSCLLPLPASAEQTLETRTVTVVLAVDEACTTEKHCDSFKTTISDISTELQRDFTLQLEIEKCIPWKCQGQFSSLDTMFPYFFKTVPKKHTDIVIGLTCRKNLEGEGGISFYQDGYILVRWTDDPRFFKKLLKHEIYHIFGATHVNQRSSLMDRFLKGDKLDRLNREIILLNHDRDFKGARFPLDSHQMEKAAAIYREIAQLNENLFPNNLSSLEKRRLRKLLQDEKPVQIQKEFVRLGDVYLALAHLDIEMKKYPRAIRECQKALRINPRRYEAYNLMGIAYRRSGDIEKSIKNYSKALKINPSYQRIYYNLGIAYMKKGDTEKARSAFQETISVNPNFADAWNNLGYIYLEEGEIEKALHHFKTAVDCNPYHPLALSNLAEVFLEKGEFDQALQYAQQALTLNTQLPGAHSILGKIHVERGELEKAEKQYKTAISLDSSYYKGYYNLGNLYLKQKKINRARESFEKAIAINPGFAIAYAGLGDAYLVSNQSQKAEEAFQEAIKRGHSDAATYLNLSFIKIHQKDPTGAIAQAQKALEINPRLAMAHYNLGIAFFMTRNFKKTEQAFVRTLELEPGLKDAWSSLGDLYFQNQQLEKARTFYLKYLAIDPGSGSVHNNLAVIYYYQKEYQLAHREMIEAEKSGFPVNEEFKKKLKKALEKQDK